MAEYKLMKHQKKAVKFLDSVDGVGALLFEPGVGKTGSTLAWVDKLADRQGEVRGLVVAPLTAADTWVLQAPMFLDSPTKARMLQGSTVQILDKIRVAGDWTKVPDSAISADHGGDPQKAVSGNRVTILSVSAGALSNYCKDNVNRVKALRAIRSYGPHLIVMDESHLIKSATANISKAMYQIGQLAPHRIILTGTVTPHSPLDVYGQWRFLAPWTFSDQYNRAFTKDPTTMTAEDQAAVRPWPWGRFKARYGVSGGFGGKQVVDYQNLEELNSRVAERSMVVLKKDALDLPPVTDVDVHVQMNPAERRAYKEMKEDLAAQMADGSLLEAPNALAKIMKLRQITAGFARNTETGETHVIGTSKQKAVCEIINTTLVGENRVVVFAYFRSECAALADSLRKGPEGKGRTVELITGSTPASERLAIRQRFADVSGNPEPVVLVAQARTMSLAVNELVVAQNAVFASMSERRDDWVQARGRLDRNGQVGQHVTFWNVFVPDTVDQVMIENHQRRGNLEKALLDHIRGTGA